MPQERIREIVGFIKEFLKPRPVAINKIILFGSYAKESFSKESDVDIAIVSKDFEKKDVFQRAEMLKGLNWALVERFMLPFDIVPISLKEWQESSSLAVEFVREGEEVFS
jgi:predicted nucleotidyltransferase